MLAGRGNTSIMTPIKSSYSSLIMTAAERMTKGHHICTLIQTKTGKLIIDFSHSISSIREDLDTLTTYLTADIARWDEVAGTYDMDFGYVTLSKPTTKKPERRGLFSDIGHAISNGVHDVIHGAGEVAHEVVHAAEEVGGDIVETFKKVGNVDLSKTVTIPVNIGTPGKVTNIVNEQGLAAAHVKLDCISCFIAGSFAITGSLSVKLFVMADFVLTAAPQDLAAELVIAADITAFKRPDMLKYDLDLFSAPIPDAGIVVPGILNLGLTAKYRLAVHTNFSGEAQLDFGLKASIPNGAQLTADFGHADQSGAKGWEGAKLDPVFDLKALTSAVKFAAANQPMLVFGVEIVKVAQFDVELNLKLPQVQATFTGIYNESGACPGNPSKTGVSLSSDVDIDLTLQIQSRLGDKKKLLYTKPLVVFWKLPLLKKCWPFNVPGLGPANPSAPEIPELPAPDASGNTE